MPWAPAAPVAEVGVKWLPTITAPPTGVKVRWLDDDGILQLATAKGYWDASAIQPVNVLGWWDGTAIQPLA